MSRQSELAELSRIYDSSALSNRNLIINGAMNVAQRDTQVTSVTSNGYKTLDRMRFSENSLGTAAFTHEQVTDAPDGFANSFKLTCTTAEGSVGAADACRAIEYRIEGQDVQQLQYGTSSAKKLTLSFYVKSSLTGTYTIALYRNETQTRVITATYTINSANTWEYKTITFDGDTSSVITNDNARRLQIYWVVGSGSDYTSTDSTSWIDYVSGGFHYGQTAQFQNTLNATWQITGVQLEVGDTATPFEHRSYGDELQKCQRYFQKYNYSSSLSDADAQNTLPLVAAYSGGVGYAGHKLTQTMRTSPTFSASAANTWVFYANGSSYTPSEMTAYETGPSMWGQKYTATTNFTAGNAVYGRANSTSSYYQFDAEL